MLVGLFLDEAETAQESMISPLFTNIYLLVYRMLCDTHHAIDRTIV